MGDRGYNAGGFAYMEQVLCPRCGSKRPLGRDAIRRSKLNPSILHCPNKDACKRRRKDGKYLHRVGAEPDPPEDLFVSLDWDTRRGVHQVSIGFEEGRGYRVMGPKYSGRSRNVNRRKIEKRDAEEIVRLFKEAGLIDA